MFLALQTESAVSYSRPNYLGLQLKARVVVAGLAKMMMINGNLLPLLLITVVCCNMFISNKAVFQRASPLGSRTKLTLSSGSRLHSSSSSSSSLGSVERQKGYAESGALTFPENMSDEWELDCYSRPVTGDDGKKLWEILITDSSNNHDGSSSSSNQKPFRYLKVLPSNLVNSRNVRKVVEELIEESPVRPKTIRFFRNQMYNMINIALSTLQVEIKPSRRCHNLLMWLQERETDVYPSMKGYNPQLRQQTILDYEISQPDKLPDVLKAESYAYVALPAEVFWNREVSKENSGKGYICPIDGMPKEGWIHGITFISKRAEAVANWMSGLEIVEVKADLLTRELLLTTDISNTFVVAPLMDQQKKEAQIFEKGKTAANGYHFVSVMPSADAEEVEGFWLLRSYSDNL